MHSAGSVLYLYCKNAWYKQRRILWSIGTMEVNFCICPVSNLRLSLSPSQLDVRGSMHHRTIHIEKSNNIQQCIKIYYSIFIWSSTCFGRHTAHHQEPKTALAASGLHMCRVVGRVVAGCCQVWQRPATTHPTTLHICKPEAASAVLGSW